LPIAALVVRFWRTTGDERQQIKWLAYFLAVTVSSAVLLFVAAALKLPYVAVDLSSHYFPCLAFDDLAIA
jgi:hypothetical protein